MECGRKVPVDVASGDVWACSGAHVGSPGLGGGCGHSPRGIDPFAIAKNHTVKYNHAREAPLFISHFVVTGEQSESKGKRLPVP